IVQAQINTMIALAKQAPATGGNNQGGAGAGQAGQGGFAGRRGGFGGSMGMGAPGGPGGQGARSPGGPGSPEDAMVAIKVDPGKLPKAEDLKALMFPSIL